MALADFVGFGFANYRSFGDGSMQIVGPWEKLHLVVGRNDVGKSNTLHFAFDTLRAFSDGPSLELARYLPGRYDVPRGGKSQTDVVILLGIKKETVETQFASGAAEALAPC